MENIPINIYLDLSKAFDTLNHHIRLHKLKYYGLNNSAIKICQSYLANRKQYVKYNNAKSKLTDINIGVPQGSIMGPLLFIIYNNDIILSSDIFKCIMYADDTTLFTSIKNSKEGNIQNQLINNGLSKISDWLLPNKLSLNAAKTKFMFFNMPHKKIIFLLYIWQTRKSNV